MKHPRDYYARDVRDAVAELFRCQDAYLDAYGRLLRIGLEATEMYGMEEGAVGFRLIKDFGWASKVMEHDGVLHKGAVMLAEELQDAERIATLLSGDVEGGVQ